MPRQMCGDLSQTVYSYKNSGMCPNWYLAVVHQKVEVFAFTSSSEKLQMVLTCIIMPPEMPLFSANISIFLLKKKKCTNTCFKLSVSDPKVHVKRLCYMKNPKNKSFILQPFGSITPWHCNSELVSMCFGATYQPTTMISETPMATRIPWQPLELYKHLRRCSTLWTHSPLTSGTSMAAAWYTESKSGCYMEVWAATRSLENSTVNG